ncbi:unnamed protein product [Boreogadus saida]
MPATDFRDLIAFLEADYSAMSPKYDCAAGEDVQRSSSLAPIDESNRSAENDEMIIKFNTAYNIAKEELPFTKFKSQIILMKKNGLNVNPTYYNDTACAQFVTFLKPGKDGNSSGQFTAVYVHMEHLAGASASAEIAGRAKKVKVSMEEGTFVAFYHFRSDLFSSFSLQIQKNDVILPQAVSGIESLLATIEAMAASPKPDGKLSEFLAAMKKQRQQRGGEPGAGTFKYQEVTLSKGEAAELAEGQPISQCAPRLQRAIVLTCESTVKHLKNRFSSLLEENTKDTPTAKAVKCFNVFSHDSYRLDNRLELLNHGVEEEWLQQRKGQRGVPTDENDDKHVIQGQKLYWTVASHDDKRALLLRLCAVCERGFSSVNRIKSDVRSSLHTETVEDLIRISVEGPQLEDYDARQDVKQWLSQETRERPEVQSCNMTSGSSACETPNGEQSVSHPIPHHSPAHERPNQDQGVNHPELRQMTACELLKAVYEETMVW